MERETPTFEAASALAEDEAAVLRAFLDNAPAFLLIKDARGRYVYVNRFLATALRRSDLLGTSANDLLPPEGAAAVREAELEILSSGISAQSLETFPGPDGKARNASILRFPIATPAQTLLALIALDVTEVNREHVRQAALLDLATDAIHVRDLSGRITYWNRAAAHLYGWSAKEATGRNALEILFRQDEQSTRALIDIQQRLLRDEAWSGELTKVTKDGGEVIVASRWTLLRDQSGEADSLLVIDSDVTQRKHVEQQLLRASRIDTIGSLAGGVAHDLNNMLMPILMGAEVIRKRTGADPLLARTLDHLEESAKKAADLVRQILTFIRGSRDVKEAVAGESLLGDLQKFLRATFPPEIRINSHAAANLSAALCRPSEIHQVLVNLCVNARDAMGTAGVLSLEVRNVTIDSAYAQMSSPYALPGQYLAFGITDTGKGIPAEHLSSIFEAYFTTKEPGKGTGLGLSNATAIVQEHGGFMRVDSEPGKTTFTVFLPSAESTAGQPEIADTIPIGSGELILVVDDEGAVLQVVRETLEAFGYRVETASDGSEAIALLATHASAVSLVVTDIAMPIVDGIALAKFLGRSYPKIPIIVASGSHDPKRREAAELASACLQKPYTAEMLLRLVADLIASAGET